MMLTLKALPLIALLTISSSMAATVNLGSVLDLRNDTQSTHYSVTILSARTVARTTEENSKVLGQWEKCFTRYKNVPASPFQKYVYVSFAAHKDSTALVAAGERLLEINEALLSDLGDVSNELVQKTNGKCKIETQTRVEFEIEMKDTKVTFKSEVWISKKGNTMSMTYAKWVGGKEGYIEMTESIPNKEPVLITIY